MIRAFAIGLAVATIRPINAMFFALYITRGFLSPHEFFGIAFWIGFTLHAIIAEIWIGFTRSYNARKNGFEARSSPIVVTSP